MTKITKELNLFYQNMRSDIDSFDPTSLVYFVRGVLTKKIKIGYTTQNAYHRMADLQVGSPDILKMIGVMNAPRYFESDLHRVLAPYRAHGEWFSLPFFVVSWIGKRVFVPVHSSEIYLLDAA